MKIMSIILALAMLLMIFPACSIQKENEDFSTKQFQNTSKHGETHSNTNENESFVKDKGGAEIVPRKYRTRYYNVPYQFAQLVGVERYWEWSDLYNTENPDDTNEMVIKKFVQYFNISREQFEKANLAFAKVLAEGVDIDIFLNPKDYADQEIYEIYNSDIIYTFDDEIINEYYTTPNYSFGWKLEYETALENGTYETRTTDWIDIEQMEAEIIAKYGEAEIVTEEVTTVENEETVPTEQTEQEKTE